jgi:protein-tyrosine phosphatase
MPLKSTPFKFLLFTLYCLQIQTLLLAPLSFIPPIKRFMRKPFMEIVNNGGLSYLNELILMVAGEKIVAVLRLFISEEHFPLAYYCTAGKDRAGLVSMLLLYLLDVPMDHIVADYEVSRHVYEQLDGHAVIASLQRLDMDPKIFLGAPPRTVYDTFQYIEKTHGSVEAYLAKYGFTNEMKQQLKRNFLGK